MTLRSRTILVSLAISCISGTTARAQSADSAVTPFVAPRASRARAAAGIVVGAGISQAFGAPVEWHQNLGGFGQRLADQTGYALIAAGTTHALLAATGWHADQQPCSGARLRCAVTRTLSLETRDGARRPNLPLFGGLLVAAATSILWRPERARPAAALRFGLSRAGSSLASAVVRRSIREFRRKSPS